MEKTFLVYLYDKPAFNIVFSKNNTIGDIKGYFKSEYAEFNIKFYINPTTEVKVFNTNKYDLTNLDSVWDQIDNGVLYLSKTVSLPLDIEEKTSVTFRNEQSYNGYNTSDLKSWLQKAVRRNHPDEAVWAAVEMYTLPKQSIVTNLFNRIRIIAMEDIGVANPLLVKLADEVLENLSTKEGKPKLPVDYEGVKKIADLVSYMARSKHLRLASDYKAVYMTPHLRSTLAKMYPNLYNSHSKCLDIKETDAKKLGEIMTNLLIEKNDCAFYIMSSILDLKKLPFKTYRSNIPTYYVLSLIENVGERLKVKFSPTVDILVKWLKGGIINSKIDYNLPLYYAMLMILKRDEIKVPDINMENVEIKNFSDNRTILKIPSYVLDKHTATGRREGKTALDFAVEGAHVENEDMELINFEYRKIYLDSKSVKPEQLNSPLPPLSSSPISPSSTSPLTPLPPLSSQIVPFESDLFDFDVRVQATVADYRSDTYLATEKNTGRYVFVKGPYKNEQDVNIPVKIYEIKKMIAPELPSIKLEKILLKPDLFPNLPWGLRRHLDRTKGYWFLISDSLLKAPAPRKMHNTPKWGDVEVIDYSKVGEPVAPKPLKLKGKGLHLYVLNMLFRYALGIPDEADRNFMLMKDGTVYSVDEEGMNADTNFKNALREKKSMLILNYVKTEWESIKPIVENWLIKAGTLKDAKWVVERLKNLQSLKGIENIFN